MVNYWWQISITALPQQEDDIFWRLQTIGCQGMATETQGENLQISAYLPIEQLTELDLAAFAIWLEQDALLSGYATPQIVWHKLAEEDWSASWKQHWQPQPIGDTLIIYPAWIEVPPKIDRKVIRLDPGSAFGSGAHATTHLCLEALEMCLSTTPNSRIADIGCGSGILGIGAAHLGATKVFALDTDPLAIKATQYNWQLNNLETDRLVVTQGSLEDLFPLLTTPLDGFVCNILLETIVSMIPQFDRVVKPKGWGILSGILMEQSGDAIQALERHNWIVATIWQLEKWACLTIRRDPKVLQPVTKN